MTESSPSVVAYEQNEAVAILARAGVAVGEMKLTGPDGSELRVVRQRLRPDGSAALVVAVRRSGRQTR